MQFKFVKIEIIEINNISDELMFNIFEFLHFSELLTKVSCVCKRFKNIIDGERTWKLLFKSIFKKDKKSDPKKSWKENAYIERINSIGWNIKQSKSSADVVRFGDNIKELIIKEPSMHSCFYTVPYVSCSGHYEWKLKLKHKRTDWLFVGFTEEGHMEGEFLGHMDGYGCRVCMGSIKHDDNTIFFEKHSCYGRGYGECRCEYHNQGIYDPEDIITVTLNNYKAYFQIKDYVLFY